MRKWLCPTIAACVPAILLLACGGPSESNATVRTLSYCGPLKVDVHGQRPERQAAVLYVHGGGWETGNRATGFERRLIAPLTQAGFVVTTIDHRLAPQHKHRAQIRDVICALRYMAANADPLGIDPNRISIIGDRAGGHLAALAGLSTPEDSFGAPIAGPPVDVKAVGAFYGPFDLVNVGPSLATAVVAQNFPTAQARRDGSPVLSIDPGDPPFLIVHGKQDRFVNVAQSVKLALLLKQSGHAPVLAVVDNADHGLVRKGGKPSPDIRQITRLTVGFFLTHLR